MSDFLNKFEDENYDGKSIVALETAEANNTSQPLHHKTNVKLDQIKQDDEIIVKDQSYATKQKKQKVWYVLGSILAVGLIALIILFISIVKVPNLVDVDLNQAKAWATNNNINLIIKQEFSLEKDENIILNQEKTKGTYLFKGGTFELVISKGANPDEKIKVPNILYMSIADLNDWVSKNKLSNVELQMAFSDSKSKDKVISYKFMDDFVNASNFTRKDGLIIKISKGKASLSKSIVVPDFKSSDLYAVKDWAEENGVFIYYAYTTHPKKAKDMIIKQSIKENTKISKEQAITVTVSLGKSVKVPDFSKMSIEQAKSYTALKLNIKAVYSYAKEYGALISQSVKEGTYVTSSKTLTIIYSEGKPFIMSLKGASKKDVEKYFYDLNLKGAKLKYMFARETKDVKSEKNLVTRSSIQNDYASSYNQTIIVYLK